MESEYFIDMVLKVLWAMAFVVGAVYTALRKIKEKRKLNNLAMYATVEVEKQKWNGDEAGSPDS